MFSHTCILFVFLYSYTLLMIFLPRIAAQKSNGPRWLIGDRDSHCGIICSKTHGKPVCGSDGRNYDTSCDLQKAKCKDRTLSLAYRGRCRGKSFRIDQPPILPASTLIPEVKELELKEAGQSKCRVERSQALEQAKRPQEAIFIPECNEDGTFAQVQCHTLTGYCWCVTTDGKPVSGSSVHNKTPVCSGNFREFMRTHTGTSGLTGSVTDKPPGPPSSGRKVSFRFFLTLNPDDGSKPTPTMETHRPDGDEITAPTLWIKHLVYKENKQNNSSSRRTEKVPSCDQERHIALEEARVNSQDATFIPDCGSMGLYKPVQCHQSTGYCWCVVVDTGRPIPGTSARYKEPECDNTAHSQVSEMENSFRDRDLTGCPEGKKGEFITSLMDALTEDMVETVNSPTPSGGGRFVEPERSHTLEERVVHWYFAQLDSNGSQDISRKEMKPFKRYVKRKAKPKRCARKFSDYCDLNKDKAISLQELKGCLGVSREGTTASISQGTRQGTKPLIGSSGVKIEDFRRSARSRGHNEKSICPSWNERVLEH
ncbi:SPARC-related modular calcium-binding protein 1 isoform X2 [Electrophorus electricus]|uniref:SPARC-related modular calcium-binding protein 1 isoform X2 n=1 Tax=Electrophorus electricus TaxID=8005 RepID=UPI0015D0B048|nr:SPARC-related modular calcium-binding protein 1 isoform X2 [Electrophorus electricus]